MGPLEKLSTRGLAPRDRLPFWNEVAERMVAPVRVEAIDPATFEADDGEWVDSLSEVLWPLLDLTYADRRPAAAGTGRREERRQRLFAVIDAELCDPALDTRRIARRMGVSMRYVQMLFAELATTPTAFIQQRRLERAAERLRREGARTSITAVAFDVGFNDLSSFCRAFRRRFDVSARDYRAGIRRRQLDN